MRCGLRLTKQAADAASKSADTSRLAMEIASRANVGITSMKLGEPPNMSINEDREFPLHCVEIILSNTGLTDAIGICCEFTAHIQGVKHSERVMSMTTDLHRDIRTAVISKSIGDIFPGLLGDCKHGIAIRNLTLEGCFSYRDIFECRTFVNFSAHINPRRKDHGKGIPGEYNFDWTTEVKSDHEKA